MDKTIHPMKLHAPTIGGMSYVVLITVTAWILTRFVELANPEFLIAGAFGGAVSAVCGAQISRYPVRWTMVALPFAVVALIFQRLLG